MLAHELRSPISAIIGYQDLISEGLLGEMDPRIAEGLQRVRSSANQLLALVASLGEADTDLGNLHVEIDDEDARTIIDDALAEVEGDANGRDTTIIIDHLPASTVFRTDRDRVSRALLLAFHAAIRSTAAGSIHIDAQLDDIGFACTIRGARFDPANHAIPNGALEASSATAMRLAMAGQAIRPLRGTVTLGEHNGISALTIAVPHAAKAIDEVADR